MVRTRTGKTSSRLSVDNEASLPNFEEHSFDMADSDADDDAPVEISSKKIKETGPDMPLVEEAPVELSLFEQVQQKKQKQEEDKLEKKKARRIKRKKVQKGQFVIQTKKATFNVVSLDTGLTRALEPEVNFRAELLKARTDDRRVKNSKTLVHRSKWIGKNLSG